MDKSSAIESKPLLVAEGITKRFPGVVALAGVDFAVYPGQLHALVGENGAGKSTLIKVLTGFYSPEAGRVTFRGRALKADTAAARAAGIALIPQEHTLVPRLSVAENIMLGGLPGRGPFISVQRMRRRAAEALSEIAPEIRVTQPAGSLSPAGGQLVEIARALSQMASVVIMDEPTTSLGEHDIARLFSVVRKLRADGFCIVYVSHKLEEVLELADTITVLRDGRLIASQPATAFTHDSLVRAMVGEDVMRWEREARKHEKVELEVRGLSRRGKLLGIDLTLHAGEILGLAGLAGSGRSELAWCLFGADLIDDGEILLDGERLDLRSPADAVAVGIGLVPEERKQQALLEVLSVRENVSISVLDRLSRFGFVRRREERKIVKSAIDDLGIRTPSTETRVASLSGGNQQKVIIARWLARKPRILIMDEPTRGIDVAAKAEIHHLIEQLADAGVAVLMASSELPELLDLCDRIVILRDGRLATTLDRSEATRERIIAYASA